MRFLLFFFFLSIPFLSHSQNSFCGTVQYDKMLKEKFPALALLQKKFEEQLSVKKALRQSDISDTDTLITIPVVVHVIYNTPASNISDEQIISQINILNEDYRKRNGDTINTPLEFKHLSADVRIQFQLANRDPEGNVTNGIIRKKTNQISFRGFEDYDNDLELKSISRWPVEDYLNIWVTTLQDKVLGYSMNPGSTAFTDLNFGLDPLQDGLVIDYSAFGKNSRQQKYNKGRTTTHEIGHWLGLKHIWGDEYCGNDYINDTPAQESSNDQLSTNNCEHFSYCTGFSSKDMSGNYMDYSPDICMNQFTNGQKSRMRKVWDTNPSRSAMLNSTGICNPEMVLTLPFFEGFESGYNLENVLNPDSNETWRPYFTGYTIGNKQSFYIHNDEHTIGNADHYQLPALDFTNTQNPVLEFNIATAFESDAQTDSIVISYNDNCSGFRSLKTLKNEDIAKSYAEGPYYPKTEDWKKIRIPLPAFAGKKIAQLRFENHSKGKNSVFLDDINIYDITEQFELILYPNPAFGEIVAQVKYKEPTPVFFQVYTSSGKLKEEITINSSNFNKVIDLKNYAPGVYFIKAAVDDFVQIKRFIVL